jgi:hypothetical protein
VAGCGPARSSPVQSSPVRSCPGKRKQVRVGVGVGGVLLVLELVLLRFPGRKGGYIIISIIITVAIANTCIRICNSEDRYGTLVGNILVLFNSLLASSWLRWLFSCLAALASMVVASVSMAGNSCC